MSTNTTGQTSRGDTVSLKHDEWITAEAG